ncbi:MAG: MBOAT family protein, partial [Erysipelotrichaceae bacterium]|nr:MBOAT family protein [Erysipelotrichaceae bacterium]
MQFTSNTFIFMFLPACMLLYFVMPSIKGKNAVLLLASLLFYALGEPLYILLMLLETLIGYLTGWMLARAETINYRRGRILLMSIVLLALPLVVFKYTGFFIDNFNKIFSLKLTVPQLPLPVGISFYTFQLIGYVADVERKKIPAERSYLRLLLFVSLFPQLVQGPILRYPDIEKQIKERKSEPKQIADGITRFIFGFGKKVIISNEIAKTVDMVFAKG